MIDQKLLPDEKCVLFCIATHLMKMVIPETFNWERLLPSFKPFRCDSAAGKEVICSIRVVKEPIHVEQGSMKVLSEVSDLLGYWFCLMETEQHYIADIQFVENGNHYRMTSDKLFSISTVYVDWDDEYAGLICSSFLMIAFAQAVVLHKTLMVHASVVEKDEEGYAFLGKSGTGKSTHSALWMRYVEDTDLLNDDNPAIHIEDNGSINVYGTPWSGKKPCYKNRKVALKALVRLEQASTNRFTWKKGVEALITLLPSCASMRWNTLLYNEMCNLMEEIIAKVNVGCLECLPNKDAALLCYEEMKKI